MATRVWSSRAGKSAGTAFQYGCSLLSCSVAAEMKTRRIESNPNQLVAAASFGLVLILNFTLAGCACSLPAPRLASQQRLRVVSPSPENFVLRLRIREPRDYRVPTDGRVTLDIPAYRAGCSEYLFGKLRIQRGADPFTAKNIDVAISGKITRQLSLKEISALPTDAEGYHLLTVRPAK